MVNTDTDIQAAIDEQISVAIARLNFHEFCDYMEPELYRERPILRLVTDAFQKVIDEYRKGKAIKVGISMPPRFGKSVTTSLFASYWLGNFPESSFMRASATNRLYQKFSYDVRNIIRSDKYKRVFPRVKMAEDKQSLDGWNLTTAKQVSYFGGGYGTSIIGFGANCACTDDMYPGITEALSEVYNENLEVWKQGSFNSRMEKNCPEIFVSTRWSKNDLLGKAIEEGKIDILVCIPALDENNQSTCEAVKTTEEYLKIKRETDESIFLAEYMQEPIEAKGLLFPMSELKTFSPLSIPPEFRYCAVDPADTGGDDTSVPFCDLYGTGIYVTDAIYNNHGTDVTIPNLVEKIVDKRLNAVEVEGVSAWILFAKDVRNKVQERYEDCDIRVIKNTANKQTRILAQSAFIKNHFYFLEEKYWSDDYRKFMKVLTAYMRTGSKRDDAPDSLAMASSYFQRNFSLW
jgi:predicted phage terminase large subunit-like protein